MFSFKTYFYTTLAFFSLTLSLNAQFKYLFTSDRWIGETYAVSRETKQGLKLKGNPLITADKPWEGGVNCFGSVLYDEGKFRMWYQIYNGKEKKDLRFATMVGYAESTDGINWIKPELGLHEYLGSKNNNIVLPSATTRHDDSRAYHRENSIGLATMRLDGFAAMEAKFFQGFLKTLPVQFSKRLFVNADAKKGFLQCELIDPETGKSVATSKKLAHFDSVKQGIEWENNFKPEDKKYILKFNLQKAGIYAFWFE